MENDLKTIEIGLQKLNIRTGEGELREACDKYLGCCENVIIFDNEGKIYLDTAELKEEETKYNKFFITKKKLFTSSFFFYKNNFYFTHFP